MKRAGCALLLASTLLAAPAFAQTRATAAVQPIAFTERTLPNGLRVYAIRDTTTPNVSIQVWYDVGGKDDPAGRSGFAHLFEHLMFKATRNLVPEQMDRLTEDVGGYNNASTGDDYTNYFEVVPANHLQRLLFAEADRMASLVVEPTSFASERDVVKEEYRQSVLARPYGKLFSTYMPALAYSRHPYARGVIGDIGNLDTASIDDVRAFHATYYRPDNAVLVVSGNFDAAQLDRWIDQYFARIAKPDRAIPRVTVTEPARTEAVTRTVYEPNTPLPAVLMSWHLPPDRDPDVAALTILNAVLSTGESSRLYESIVYRDQLAQSADSILDLRQGTGNLALFAMMAGGKDVATGEAALKREVARLRDQPVSATELSEAKNEILTTAIRARETAEGKASTLANSVIIDGDPRAADKQLAAIAAVTAADVQRVARRYLGEQQVATIRYLPAEQMPNNVRLIPITVAPTVQVAALTPPVGIAVVTPAPVGERVAPPPPAAVVAANLPKPVETKLANGLRVITVERHDLPLVTASLVASGGAAGDPATRAGASSLTADLLTKGTKTRSATEIARAVESLGGSIGADASRDGASIDMTVKSDQLAPAMTILADVAQHPAFAADEIERARVQAIDGVTVAMKNPAQLAGLIANRVVFGSGPYAPPLEGTPASLKALTQQDIQSAYGRTWRPDRAALVLVGDITPVAAKALAEKQFGTWRAAGGSPAAVTAVAAPTPRVVVVDVPSAGQAGVVVARPSIVRADERYYPLAVANTVLGGGFSSRLNQEIRIKRGLAYGASSGVSAGRLPGSVMARTQTKNTTAAEVVTLIAAEMARMGTAAVPDAELATRKAVLVGGFGRTVETTDGIADLLGGYVLQDVPIDELQRYTTRIEGVDARAVQAAAALLDPKAASIVVVGDAKQFLPALRKAYPTVQVIPEAALDLATVTLTR
ncbi:insulinase family protein [Microvirga sp. SRT01]|uniref:Insulinase family protein n=1 Tax=Sphingomonas longa TaxID=2778730 RepID=A0ABS2D4E7_9SPHN|nr:pitrilysin family protein [Microvirga sp. SRT01]MBM6575798.1 insulinase family protein [Sphingomonas sp. BT552]MBR7708845.1 insulinase family protein [Microvirga sp. SRT01]